VDERPLEARTDHRCILGELTRRLARADGASDRARLAAEALDRMLADGEFDRCCVPRYLALAPERHPREVQIPIAREADVETRVVVWPVGARDFEHPHVDGWTVFIPARGELATVEKAAGASRTASLLAPREPVVLRPEEPIRHLVRNIGEEPALTVHISGRSDTV